MSEHDRGSLETTRQMAREGDPIAQFQLGEQLYENVWCDNAVRWYRKSAEQGYAPAQHKLSLVLMDEAAPIGWLEEGKETFWNEARAWNAKAREQGNSPAIYELAQSYRYGKYFVLKVDMVKAVKLHKQAASSGYPRSQLALGNIYLEKADNQGDVDYGLSCLISAANSGMKPAQKALARAFAGGQPGVAQNVSMAREWLRQAENNTTTVERNVMSWLTHN